MIPKQLTNAQLERVYDVIMCSCRETKHFLHGLLKPSSLFRKEDLSVLHPTL